MKKTPHPIYTLYRKTPPTERRGVTVIVAYWHGWDGVDARFVRGSAAWWAMKAGRDNRKSERWLK